MVPEMETLADISLSGKRSTDGSLLFTKKYGERVLSPASFACGRGGLPKMVPGRQKSRKKNQRQPDKRYRKTRRSQGHLLRFPFRSKEVRQRSREKVPGGGFGGSKNRRADGVGTVDDLLRAVR